MDNRQQTDQPTQLVHYSAFKKSSGYVATGVGMSIVGAVLLFIGQGMNASSSSLYSASDDGDPFLGIGAIVLLAGAIAFMYGAVQAAKNIDLAGQLACNVLQREALARYDEPETQTGPLRTYEPTPVSDDQTVIDAPTRRSRRDM